MSPLPHRPDDYIPPIDRLVATAAAADRLGVCRRTLTTYAQQGRLTVYRLGGRNRFDVEELDALIVRRAV